MHYQACHGLWELACDENNHKYMTFSMFEVLVAMSHSREMRVQSIAAAAIWKLAQTQATALRMPVAAYVPHLLAALFAEKPPEPSDEAAQQAAAESEMCAVNGGNIMGHERIVVGAEEDDASTEEEQEMQAARAVAGTGYPLIELRVWQAG